MLSYLGAAVALWIAVNIVFLLLVAPSGQSEETSDAQASSSK
jgi:hypothetical protein